MNIPQIGDVFSNYFHIFLLIVNLLEKLSRNIPLIVTYLVIIFNYSRLFSAYRKKKLFKYSPLNRDLFSNYLSLILTLFPLIGPGDTPPLLPPQVELPPPVGLLSCTPDTQGAGCY